VKGCTYFVEGECEQKLLNAIKTAPSLVQPGKVRVFNVIQDVLSKSHLYPIKEGLVVFVFDSDVPKTNLLKQNIDMVKRICPAKSVKLVFLVQVMNLEDELLRATNIKKITELTNSKSEKDFKSDFIALKDCRGALVRHEFDIRKMWNQTVSEPFTFVRQGRTDVILK
jgi:hypothetical protein